MTLGARRRTLPMLALALALFTEPAAAEYRHRVVVLAAASEAVDPVKAELEARLRGELTAAGMEVVVVPAPDAMDVRDAVETSARELSPSAVIGVREPSSTSPEGTGVEVWISDRLSGRTLVQRAKLNGSRRNELALLAIQVSDLFEARLGLSWIEPEQPAPRAPPVKHEPATPVAAPAPVAPTGPRGPRFTLGAGVGLVHQLNDSISAWFPSLQVGIEPAVTSFAIFAVRANVGFTPARSEVQHLATRAHVTQGWGFAQGLLRFVPSSAVQPTLSLGGGMYSVDVDGEADAPDRARDERTWSAAATLGVGVWVQTNDAFALALEGQGLSTWSKTVVRLRGRDSATFGFPAAMVSASWIGRY